jgi:hypothetical protein
MVSGLSGQLPDILTFLLQLKASNVSKLNYFPKLINTYF